MSSKKFHALFVLGMMILAAMFTGGCGGSGGSDVSLVEQNPTPTPITSQDTTPEPTPTPSPTPVPVISPDPTPIISQDPTPTQFTVTFDSYGGSEVSAQILSSGSNAEVPDEPHKDNASFMGWYPSEGFAFRFDFSTPISRDITLYAKWWDHDDTTDTDGDGLVDSLENTYGTDINNVDTDGDGLSDYEELYYLEYNPLARDTNGDGIEDPDEDADKDGLTNIEETARYGTNMIIADTDRDGLTDYEEAVTHRTDPLKPDTDGDGVNDGTEVAIGSDPLVAEQTFATTLSSDRTSEDPDAIDIAVTMISSADSAGTLRVSPADYSDNPLITPAIPGYLAAYNISADGEFTSAEITFTLGSGVWVESDDFQPRIYFLNEETGVLEEVPNQTAENGKITASVSHFSVYVLINQVVYGGVWRTEIRPPSSGVSIDVVFVIDCSGSMYTNDPDRLAISLPQQFIDKLRDDCDRAAAVKFNSYASIVHGLTNDKDALKTAIDGISYSGLTNGSDGLHSGLEILGSSEAAYKFVIFLTDGEDNEYSYSYSDLIAQARNSGIIVYTIGMGSAVESTLRQVASETGGAYYKATTGMSIADMVNLNDIFNEIYQETIDMATDSNGDGISDYYTKLLNNGLLVMSNGSSILTGVTDRYGTDNDDWDGDGLKNGEEITIVSVDYGSKIVVTAYMNTNPIYWDTDFDGYSDGEEVNTMKTSPLKYTIAAEDISKLINDSNYPNEYVNSSMPDANVTEEKLMKLFTFMFAGDIKKIAVKTFIDYFHDYATSEEVLERDALAARRLQQCKDLHDGIALISDVIKAAKTITSIAEDIGSGAYDSDAKARQVFRGTMQRLDKLMEAKYRDVDTINSTARAALFERSSQKAEMDLLVNILDQTANSSKELISAGTELNALVSDANDFLNSGTWVVSADILVRTTNACLAIGKTVADVSNEINKFKMPCAWEWMSSVKGVKFGVGDVLQVTVYAADIAQSYYEIAATYGQIAANYYEYNKYLSLLRRIANDDKFSSYVQAGAAEIADMFDKNGNPDWQEFDRKVRAAKTRAVLFTAFKSIVDFGVSVAEKRFPVLILADIAYSIFMANSGIKEGYETLVNCQVYYSITDASRNLFLQAVRLVNGYLESKIEGDSATKYAVQLAQSRIVGVDTTKKYLLNGKLTSWLIGLVVNKSNEDIKTEYEGAIRSVYEIARKCRLMLSEQLPMYSDFQH